MCDSKLVISRQEDGTPCVKLNSPMVFERTLAITVSTADPDTLKELAETVEAIKEFELREAEVQTILSRIPRSWQECDPGKSGPDCSFVIQQGDGLKRVAIRELLLEGAIFTGTTEQHKKADHEAWQSSWPRFTFVPTEMPVVNLSEVEMRPCPECGKPQPLIREHQQAWDGPDGDTWVRRLLMICCDGVQVLDKKSGNDRIYD